MDLMTLAKDPEVLKIPLQAAADAEDEEGQLEEEFDLNVYEGNEKMLTEKVAKLIITFTNMIYDEKKEINRNYQSFMEIILRSKEKEKDIITDYLGSMTVEERRVEDVFKANKLERWSRGQQKGLYMYESKTYEEERLEMEQQALREARLNKKDVITDRNRDIFDLELMIHEDNEKELDVENERIDYRGEDADFDDVAGDGDEMY